MRWVPWPDHLHLDPVFGWPVEEPPRSLTLERLFWSGARTRSHPVHAFWLARARETEAQL